jgi:hypothetical protein
MSTTAIRGARFQARTFHKAALKSTCTATVAGETKSSHAHHHSKHNQIEQKQSPSTPDATSARADWQRYRDIEEHQIWMFSPQKHSFQTKSSSPNTRVTEPTPAMTFRKDREMHIAARQAARTISEENENPDREFMKTWLGVVRETGYRRPDWVDAVLAGRTKVQRQTFIGRLFGGGSSGRS